MCLSHCQAASHLGSCPEKNGKALPFFSFWDDVTMSTEASCFHFSATRTLGRECLRNTSSFILAWWERLPDRAVLRVGWAGGGGAACEPLLCWPCGIITSLSMRFPTYPLLLALDSRVNDLGL